MRPHETACLNPGVPTWSRRWRRVLALGLAATLLLLLVACAGGEPQLDVLGGSPRYPSAEGLVESVTIGDITLRGGRRFPLAEELASFSTYTLEPIPLVHRVGQYVHVGLEDGAVAWVATIGAVGNGETVVYAGKLLHVDDERRAIFSDGTVLRLGEDVEPPAVGTRVRVEIDAAEGVATSIGPG